MPVGDGVIANNFDLPLPQRGILVREVATGVRKPPQAVDKSHDFSTLRTTLRNSFQEFQVHINLALPHLSKDLMLIEAALEFFGSEPVS